MFPVRIRVALGLITALVIAFVSSTTALADGPWPNDPQGPVARTIAELYWIMFAAAVLVLAIVNGGIIYAGIKFRERPGHVARQFHGHNFLELTWTVIPTLMVVSFSVLSWQKLDFINNTHGGDVGMVVQAQGSQWTWSFSYPHEDRFKLKDGTTFLTGAQELHVPVGMKVRIELSAKDVIHSFWVPSVGGKKDAVPGRATDLWIQADKPGSYKGQCLEFCGDGHADMLITLVAHPVNEYAAWIDAAKVEAERFTAPETIRGKELFQSLACAGCHTVQGLTAGKFPGAPDLTRVAGPGNKDIAGVLSPVNEENLRKWLANPPAVKPGTQMPNLGLSDQQITDLVNFLLILK
ncbi:MAG: cytochrome c oxidase subunit II [Chloroflexota bacterium]